MNYTKKSMWAMHKKIKNYWCDCHVAEHFAKNDATLVRKPSHSPATFSSEDYSKIFE